MLRIFLHYVLPFLIPFIIYFGYVFLVRRGKVDWVNEGPWAYLVGSGVLLVGASLVGLALLTGGEPEATYQPPRVEDGRVVPGGFGN